MSRGALIRGKDKASHVQTEHKKSARLWRATLHLPYPLEKYLSRYGFPIRYDYVKQAWPSPYYQTVYATEIGSAEMPSAGRAFTDRLIKRLITLGIRLAPLILHTGVASLESYEPPYEEYYRVSAETVDIVNAAKERGNCVIAVGSTVVRALETVTDKTGTIHSGEGWTDVIVTPATGILSVSALLTGFHEPHSTHLSVLEALAGPKHLRATYTEALRKGYLWHEFRAFWGACS